MKFFPEILFPLLAFLFFGVSKITSKYKTNKFIASDELVPATHLQKVITLQTKMFIASYKCALCWGQTLLVLEMNAFHAGNEHFSAGDEHVENVRLNFSQAQTHS